MSDQSDDFRQADGRFGKGNPGGPGRPRFRERAAALDLLAAEAGPELIDVAVRNEQGEVTRESRLTGVLRAPRFARNAGAIA